MEHWLDGDKWDQVGKYTESDFEEDINNIHYDKTMLLAAHMGKLANDYPSVRDLKTDIMIRRSSSIRVQLETGRKRFRLTWIQIVHNFLVNLADYLAD